MRAICLVSLVALTACYSEASQPSTTPQWGPGVTQGPPGGAMDPGYGYEDPNQPGYPAGYPSGYPAGTEDQAPQTEQPADPAATGDGTGAITDGDIDTTLAPYGQWTEDAEYGRVWRPDVTVVGVDFTPYETCGSWVYTDFGWTYSCDWSWGWLPFHYGQWAWCDSYWGWVPGYDWSPAWVDWRSGGGYVGWRPQRPRVRDHRAHPYGPNKAIRSPYDSHWHFAATGDLGKGKIRPHLYKNLAEGIRVTNTWNPPPAAPTRTPIRDVMASRYERVASAGAFGPQRYTPPPSRTGGFSNGGTYTPPPRTYAPPSRSGGFSSGNTYTPPPRTYNPPPSRSGGFSSGSGNTYHPPPSRGFGGSSAPPPRTWSGGSYSPPKSSGFSRGGSTYNPPSRGGGFSSGGSSYSPPSRSSSGGSSGKSSGFSSGGSSYSPPSRSSSSSSSHSSSSSSHSSSGSSRSSSGGTSVSGGSGRRH